MKSIAIIAGGIPPDTFIQDIRRADFVIGVDRGAYWLAKHQIKTDLAIGDFDSVTKAEKSLIRKQTKIFHEYPSKKDATDLELAIDEAVQLRPKSVMIYGAIGTRFDHTYAAVGLLLRLVSHNILGQIVDNFNKISVVRRLFTVERSQGYTYVSVFPLADKTTITMKGFMYDISRRRLIPGTTMGVSNEILHKKATITPHEGAVLVIQSRDRRVR